MKKSFWICLFWLRLLISTGIMIYIVLIYSPAFVKVLTDIRCPGMIILILLNSLVLIQVLAVLRWQIFLRPAGLSGSFFQLLKINLKSIFWGILLPSSDGFALLRIYYLEKKFPDRKGSSAGSVIMEKLSGAFCLCLLALSASLLVKQFDLHIRIRIILVIMMLILCTLIILPANLKLKTKCKSTGNGGKSWVVNVSDFIKNMIIVISDRKMIKAAFRALPLILLVQLLSILNVHLLFLMLGSDPGVLNNLFLVPVIQIVSLIPVSISGIGVREGMFGFLYSNLGIGISISFTVSVLNFLFLTFLPALGGGIVSLVELMRSRK